MSDTICILLTIGWGPIETKNLQVLTPNGEFMWITRDVETNTTAQHLCEELLRRCLVNCT